jgi:hypothetical protein
MQGIWESINERILKGKKPVGSSIKESKIKHLHSPHPSLKPSRCSPFGEGAVGLV